MTEMVGYEIADIHSAITGVDSGSARTVVELATAVIDLTAAAKALAELRDDHLRRLHTATAAMPRGDGEVDLPQHGTVKIRVAPAPSRTNVQHAKIAAALDRLADMPAHRVDPATGEDIGRAAARLKLREQCSSPSWRWGELEHLGLESKGFCVERTDTKISITGDAVKIPPTKVPRRRP